ncbi:hypothetical protein EVAR_51308_1 [Eumeta japonica]|uniref:Uncharacterized protein n=1 Tax=Eumeta variegata TaxID=151549 RepID=A0A4C1XV88_EUMVA|nr:hypothetical protein EVAR_51308_1 [Eumeta japonica]
MRVTERGFIFVSRDLTRPRSRVPLFCVLIFGSAISRTNNRVFLLSLLAPRRRAPDRIFFRVAPSRTARGAVRGGGKFSFFFFAFVVFQRACNAPGAPPVSYIPNRVALAHRMCDSFKETAAVTSFY